MKQSAKPRHRGKRGGYAREAARDRDIHAKVRGVYRALPPKDAPTGAVLERSSKYFSIAEIDETEITHVIPRKSITVKQLLAARSPQLETEARHARQLDQKGFNGKTFLSSDEAIAHHRMIETTDQRQTWRADRSLLINGTPGAAVGTFKREGSVSKGLNKRKTLTTIREEPLTDTVISPAVEIANPDVFDE